jgi:uncharacterized protein (TIGR00730 family)
MIPLDTHTGRNGGEPPARRLAICVFCGARPGRRPTDSAVAREVGACIGTRGHELVYGGSGTGLMVEVAKAALLSGATITGYLPRYIHELELGLGIVLPEQTLHITADLFERKRRMIEHADVFIALPGGYGTLDEICEVLSRTYLSIDDKPLILLNADSYWDRLVDLVDSLYAAEFADKARGVPYLTARSPAEAVALAEQSMLSPARDSLGVFR